MKITDVKVLVLEVPPAPGQPVLTIKNQKFASIERMVVQIHTDEGIVGETVAFGAPRTLGAYITTLIKPMLIGRSLEHREAIWRDMFEMDRLWGTPVHAIGTIDVALWDLYGKSVNRSISNILGSYRDKLPVYASSMTHPTVQDFVDEAIAFRARNWHAYKIHGKGEPDFDIEVCTAVRDAVGDTYPLMLDVVGAYNQLSALRVGRVLGELNFLWYEEPLRDYDLHGYRMLSEKLSVPLIAGEANEGFLYTMPPYITSGALSIMRGDVSYKGGVTQLYKAAALAEAFGMNFEVHTNIYAQLDAANLHVASCIRNTTYFERLVPEAVWNGDWGVQKGIEIDADGYAHVPTGPGIGINLDAEWVRAHTVAEL